MCQMKMFIKMNDVLSWISVANEEKIMGEVEEVE